MRRRHTALLASAVLGILLSGCASYAGGGASDRRASASEEYAVGRDRRATPAELIEVGTGWDVAAIGERTLVLYHVEAGDDDEVEGQTGWRLYDGDGTRIADGKMASRVPDVLAATDSFLVGDVRVALDGRTSRLPAPRTLRPTPARPGDVLVDRGFDRDRILYRPGGGGAFFALGAVPGQNPQGVALASDGSVWVGQAYARPGDAPVSRSPDGRAPWGSEQVPIGRKDHPLMSGITAIGSRVLVAASTSGTAEGAPLAGLWQRRTVPGATWRRVPLDGAALGRTLTPGVAQLSDGRLVVNDDDHAYVRDGADWRRIDFPTDAEPSTLNVVGDDLYVARYPRYPLSVSHDEGRTWQSVAR